MIKKLLISVGFIFFLSAIAKKSCCNAQTTIPPGNVSGNWTLAGSPYNITGHILIPSGVTLTIDPGVEVIFQGHYKLNVQGNLIAIGTPTDSISFTSVDTSIGWLGLKFDITSATEDSSIFSYCKIQSGKSNLAGLADSRGGAFMIRNFSKIRIDHCLITNNSASLCGGGIYCTNSTPTIIHNTISNNTAQDGGGIFCSAASPIILDNVISHNKAIGGTIGNNGGGIYCNVSSSPMIKANMISNNFVNQALSNIDGAGGGIHCVSSSPTIEQNKILSNSSPNGGGISCLSSSAPQIKGNIIDDNHSTSNYGGGIYCNNSSPIIDQDTIINNFTNIQGAGIGCINYAAPVISNSMVNNNLGAAGIYFLNATAQITNNSISNNGSAGIHSEGTSSMLVIENNNILSNFSTGIWLHASTSRIHHNTISSNSNGGIFSTFSSSNINHNTISYNTNGSGIITEQDTISFNFICNNTTDENGGGITCGGSSFINNNVICNNSANNNGGGIFANQIPHIYNCTIANNWAQYRGGGLYCENMTNPDFKNSILYGNNTGTGEANAVFLYQSNCSVSFMYSNIEGALDPLSFLTAATYTGTYVNNINADPLFVSPTPGTGAGFDGIAADWSLQTNSPCINTGTPDTSGMHLPTTDFAGNLRVYGDSIDMGAYESTSTIGLDPLNMGLSTWTVFPNPAKDFININSYTDIKGATIEIKDTHGKTLDKETILNSSHQQIDISLYRSGVYFVYIYFADGKSTFKILKN